MHVEVNEQNIAVFELVQFTGNSKEDLLEAAAKASADGYVLHCQIPDPEAPIAINAFEHFESTPAPPADVQLEIADQVNTYSDRCRYEKKTREAMGLMDSYGDRYDGGIWICIIHHANSRHEVTGPESQVQCLFLDPYPVGD